MPPRRLMGLSRSAMLSRSAEVPMFAAYINIARSKFAEPNRGPNAVGAAVFALLLILLIVRLTQGVDLSDESYYAIFIDDWLKGGIATSTLLSIHQTAALIVYPAARLY